MRRSLRLPHGARRWQTEKVTRIRSQHRQGKQQSAFLANQPGTVKVGKGKPKKESFFTGDRINGQIPIRFQQSTEAFAAMKLSPKTAVLASQRQVLSDPPSLQIPADSDAGED